LVDPLITTKLYIPPTRPEIVPRPRLIERLDEGLYRKLSLLSAPAGFGKTTLVIEWLGKLSTDRNRAAHKISWLSLDENDNDLTRFLTYMIAALNRIEGVESKFGKSALSMLQSHQPPEAETVITSLINEISSIPFKIILVLDDYHLIEDQAIHNGLTFLLNQLPPSLHIAILTREDPHLPLARLHARDQITELRSTDLRFTSEETAEFLNQIMGLDLLEEDIEALEARTEGWVAGLQLAAISLQGQTDPSKLIQSFTGSNRFVLEYLIEEVLDHQPEDIQYFLLQTSILNRLTGGLCDALTGQENGQETLEMLDRSNLFVISLDNEQCWYRYHHLFANLLQSRLKRYHPDHIPDLHLKASRWFEKAGQFPEAIDHALKGSHFTLAAEFIGAQAKEMIRNGHVSTFLRWMNSLPKDITWSNPLLSIYHAWCLLMRREDISLVDEIISELEKHAASYEPELTALKALQATYKRQISEAIGLAKKALSLLPEEDSFFRQSTSLNLSASLFLQGDNIGGEKVIEDLVRTVSADENRVTAVIALCRLGTIRVQQGDLFGGQEYYQQAIELAKDDQGRLNPIACEPLIGSGRIFWEWYEFDQAQIHTNEGIRLSALWRNSAAIEGYIVMALLQQSIGNESEAAAMMEAAKNATDTYTGAEYVASHAAFLDLLQGNLRAAETWASNRQLSKYSRAQLLEESEAIGSDVIRIFELLVFARILIARSRYQEAEHILKLLQPRLEKIGYLGKIIEAKILRAEIALQKGDRKIARSLIEKGLALGEKGMFLRLFMDHSEGIADLIEELHREEFENELVRRLIQEMGTKSPVQGKAKPLVDPLSDREIQVLGWLESDYSVPEIADELVITTSTLRTHIRNIYQKLNVHSRFEAVSKARDHGMI
jgi:LuxR family maltose regulon positive regulatory protein